MRTLPFLLRVAALLICLPAPAFAQRALHWDELSATVHLNADGSLQLVETQAMVFTGDWNGGERAFDIRPRQTLRFDGIARWNGTAWQEMNEDADLDTVDDYAWIDRTTLRWRSRSPSQPSFNRTAIRYQLRYTLSGIVLKDGDHYLLNHDFAFPDRAGVIRRFELRLTLDSAWQAMTTLPEVHTATALAPGATYVVRVPLRYVGAGTPAALDGSRPPSVRMAVAVLFGFTMLAAVWFFVREQSMGRFAPLDDAAVNEEWLRAHLLKHPAEVVAALWDDSIGQPEVVALLARMTAEGKLESGVSNTGKRPGMTLRLKVDRAALDGYERALIDALFFAGRSTTSTDEVKAHYTSQGFNPVSIIQKDLEAKVGSAFPSVNAPRRSGFGTFLLFAFALAALVAAWWFREVRGVALVLLLVGSAVAAGLGAIPGVFFRRRIDWRQGAALLCLSPAFAIAAGTAAFLWWYAGAGNVELSSLTVASIAALAAWATTVSINALRSRQTRAGIALRKTLAAGRAFFMKELLTTRPALRDEWYPWVLAFGLGKQMDDWSVRNAAHHTASSTLTSSSGSSPTASGSSASPSSHGWTGFGGGQSGGAGAGASWAAAAGGLAAGVSPPSSSGSGGGGGSSGGGSSSGGGGGGGW